MGNQEDTVPARRNLPTRGETLFVLAGAVDHAEPAQEGNPDPLCPHLAAACIYARGGDTGNNQAATKKQRHGYVDVDAGEIL